MNNTLSDKALIKGCIAGKAELGALFVERFSDSVFRTIQSYLKNRNIDRRHAEIEDLRNAVFVSLFENKCKKMVQFRGDNGCSLNSWICLIAVRTTTDYLRKNNIDMMSRSIGQKGLGEISNTVAGHSNPEMMAERSEDYQQLKEAIAFLGPKKKLLIKLHWFKDLSVTDTAKMMGITDSNALVMKHRIMKKLRAVLGKKYNQK
jgi:RNA polymerase sigma-70 factor (ECF subfamily)